MTVVHAKQIAAVSHRLVAACGCYTHRFLYLSTFLYELVVRLVPLTNGDGSGGFVSTERIMEELAVVPSDTPLVVAVRHLACECRNALASLQFFLDSNRDLLMPLPTPG